MLLALIMSNTYSSAEDGGILAMEDETGSDIMK